MFIYFKKNSDFQNSIFKEANTANWARYIAAKLVQDYEGCPFIDISNDPDIVYANENLEKFFLKATIITSQKYICPREYGIYKFGKAKAELILTNKNEFDLKIETFSWDGIKDMKILQEKLWAGSLAPVISYKEKQLELTLPQILRQILDSMKLNKFQRFVLALRMTK